jgi:hypothetical protein
MLEDMLYPVYALYYLKICLGAGARNEAYYHDDMLYIRAVSLLVWPPGNQRTTYGETHY